MTVIVAVAFGVAGAMSHDVALPVAASAITSGLGILSVILVAYRLLDTPSDSSRKIGVFLGLIAAIGIAYGGYWGCRRRAPRSVTKRTASAATTRRHRRPRRPLPERIGE